MVGKYVRSALILGAVALGAPLAVVQSQKTVNVAAERLAEARTVTVDVDNAPLEGVLQGIARQSGLNLFLKGGMIAPSARVTVHVQGATPAEAFASALVGTDLRALISSGNVAVAKASQSAIQEGIVKGTVIDATTKRPLKGVTVSLDGEKRGISTDEHGVFTFASVAPGPHYVATRLLGYVRTKKSVNVSDAAAAVVNIELQRSAAPLDQVVVTGTVVATELRAVPSAITVITAKQIEERGITQIQQLFRGDVPGLFTTNQTSTELLDEVTMFSRGATALGGSLGTRYGTNPIKTYVDGIELSNPGYLSQIDPKSIERIEILTGPQASTIYGSNALNGVMQIFTKRGTGSAPQLTLNLLSGWVQNNFNDKLTPQHDNSAQLAGVEGRISYSGGGSWVYTGAWTPAKQLARVSTFGGVRLALPTSIGSFTTDLSIRRGDTRSVSRGGGFEGSVEQLETNGYWTRGDYTGVAAARFNTLTGRTTGLTMSYAPTSWWSHEIIFGEDASVMEDRGTIPTHNSVADTTLSYIGSTDIKRSMAYNTTARIPLTSRAQGTVTFGADGWRSLSTYTYGTPQSLTLIYPSVYREASHNTGAFLQAQLGMLDHLFFTYGLRAEWNPSFGEEANPNYAPRYGVVYTTDVGSLTAKIRGSYGRSTRPPVPSQKLGQPSTSTLLNVVYGPFDRILANPDLSPENQQGAEGGLELYFGSRASLEVTRYNQTVNDLIIEVVGVDSVRSLQPNPKFLSRFTCADIMRFGIKEWCSSQDAQGYGYAGQIQNMNVAGIRNQGWELTGNIVTGPVTTRGTYSWTKSRSMGVTPQYAALVGTSQDNPQYTHGATFRFLPEHTWAVGMTYARAGTTVALTVNGTGKIRNYKNELYNNHLSEEIRLREDVWNVRGGNPDVYYVSYNNAYALADLTASHRLTRHVETVLEMQNIANRYQLDQSARDATIGRQTRLGMRIR